MTNKLVRLSSRRDLASTRGESTRPLRASLLTMIRDRDVIASEFHQEQAFTTGHNPLQVTFRPAPEGKLLIVTYVSALVSLPSPGELQCIELTGDVAVYVPWQSVSAGYGGLLSTYTASATTLVAVSAGHAVVLTAPFLIEPAAVGSVSASISGYLVDVAPR